MTIIFVPPLYQIGAGLHHPSKGKNHRNMLYNRMSYHNQVAVFDHFHSFPYLKYTLLYKTGTPIISDVRGMQYGVGCMQHHGNSVYIHSDTNVSSL